MNGDEASPEMRAATTLFDTPGFARWLQMVQATGGCSHPVRLRGGRTVYDAQTGEVYHHYASADEPTGYLLTACGNRRASRCQACARTYQADTFHLISAGLRGGKGVAAEVREHPRVFATFTAPSFGPVHGHRANGACRPRRDRPMCAHGRPMWCDAEHGPGGTATGQALCAECYDYTHAVLWNAYAGKLWQHLTLELPRVLAVVRGCSRAQLRREVRVSFAKVVEYQARGSVHFHAVIRADGPQGSDDAPPAWLSTDVLTAAISQAARAVVVETTRPATGEVLVLTWGRQLDIRPIDARGTAEPDKVAGYVAKYATKGAESAGTVDRRIRRASDVDVLDVSEHARQLIRTCFALSTQTRYKELRFAAWAHMLGYRGHFSTKSRRYSTTLTRIRQERAEFGARAARVREGVPEPVERSIVVESAWTYAGSGLSPGERVWSDVARRSSERERNERAAFREAARRRASATNPSTDHDSDQHDPDGVR